ncbi:hypothetical protein Kpol_423p13 [Vanderwaltozyma polyspora DSM 70294]|uniref:Histone H2A.Z-specific chaperone CHZ1 n=1 Tax=Vanderwaltozyma polyspora (strain ATCC 22028 / DSM 70294 / BCRC 21397 / CBS 2163 / NBRC 10782 / NRRL Y-8283 / UCD 57-17) TaxID=436907 RepID=CHZ1_VANPO|nr:uncharacterized protein Kpol_423p13 [Vanderwaltozyma polyspora DSM 70294]A7TR90.1 RecName: Full=Histone H2A.Z-specific chaperone CHZ1 [Vanderwaltozyma polyspora DSM 70294]EDO15223.1 hypothetical protein Kpol_423p13 [Vanderwaltozyma polyspora DSM 70294]
MAEELKEKRELEVEEDNTKKDNSDKKSKVKRRRRNYDDLDAEVTKDEKSRKTKSGKSGKNGSDSESEVDDAKLDTMISLEDEQEDDLAEIDTSNIIVTGRRTRGKIIDYKKAAEELAAEGKISLDEDEDEDDEDAKEDDGEFDE